MRWYLSLLVLLFTRSVEAQLPAEQQQTLAKELGARVQRSEVWTDQHGNVTGLVLINHQALTPSAGEKPGVNDADLLRLRALPKLTAINLEAQPIGDVGLQVLKQFPDLKQVGFHYMAKASGATAAPDFITVIDGMRSLEIIEIKHNFRMKSINVQKLTGTFPKVWRLVLDTPLSADQTLHLIRLCPNVTDLQLHRTEVTAEQLATIGKLLPKLEVLWLKPKQGLTPGHLTALKRFERLRIFSPQSFREALKFEGAWDVLTELPNLKRLEIADAAQKQNAVAMKQLKQQRPQLVIDTKLTRSRNYQGL